MCHDVAVGIGTSCHIKVLRRYSPVRATEIIPKDTCITAMKVQIIVLCRYGPVQDTQIMTKGTYNLGCERRNYIKSGGSNVSRNQKNAVIDSL